MKRTDEITITMRIWEFDTAIKSLERDYNYNLALRMSNKVAAAMTHEKAMSAIGNVPEGK